MTSPEKLVERAIRMTPTQLRGRYAAEWRGDLISANSQGLNPKAVARGALKMATRLRLRQIEGFFTGADGPLAALAAWASLTVLAAASLAFGSLVLLAFVLALIILATAFARAGLPSHWSHLLMLGSTVVGVGSFAFAWWAVGARIDAADNMTTEPAAASWGVAAMLLTLVCAVGFLVATLIAVRRERRKEAH